MIVRTKTFALLALLVIVVVGILALTGTFSQTYIASGHPEWPPIMYQDGDNITGAGADLVKMIADDLGFNVSLEYQGQWDEVQKKAKDGQVDILVAAYKTAERETYMDYSIAYVTDPISVYVKKGKGFTYNGWNDLIGKKGVLTVGDSYGQEFDKFIEEKLTTVRVKTMAEAFNLLKEGQADYFVYALYSGEKMLAQNNLAKDIEILPKEVVSENFYITISKKSPLAELLPDINARIENYKNDGTIEKLITEYRATYLGTE